MKTLINWALAGVLVRGLAAAVFLAGCGSAEDSQHSSSEGSASPDTNSPLTQTTYSRSTISSLPSSYSNPAMLGAGLSGKSEAGFMAPTTVIERDGTINATYHLAILNKTSQTITGCVL